MDFLSLGIIFSYLAHRSLKCDFPTALLFSSDFTRFLIDFRTKRFRFKVTDFKPLGGGKTRRISPPQRKSMFWSFWDKSSKWNYPQVGGRGSENLVGLNFWPLFVTKNGILRFSAFGLIKWSWIKNSKWNYPHHWVANQKIFPSWIFHSFLLPKLYIAFFQLLAR